MITLLNCTLYANGEPLVRFNSNIAACLWLRDNGFRRLKTAGATMLWVTQGGAK